MSSIGEQFELYSGNTPSRMNKNQFDGSINWITSGELKEHYISDTKEKISEEAAKNNSLKLLPVGTFVIAIYGLEANGVRGTCSITTRESTISQACMAFTSKMDIQNEFLYSWYKKHGNIIGIKYAQGTKQQNLSYDIIERFNISYPCMEEQKKLIRFISLIDQRIATQNKIIEDLKKLKSAIIEIEYSPKDSYHSHIGGAIVQISKRNKDNHLCNVLSVSNRQGFIKQSEQFEDRNVASDDTSNYKIVEKNDFAYNPARINVGSIARLTKFETGIVSPMYICFRTKDCLLPEYLELFFESRNFFYHIQKRLEGSVRLCLSYEELCNIPIVIPSIEKQKQVDLHLSKLAQKIDLEMKILQFVQQQKTYLLHQMFI
ncbi:MULTISPECIES: restriction endonuclease subunit S [Bacteroides]|uniref:Restriction endonuclease subunit S n=3 Tax=Bacteroides TaxID=816 RepID=A0A7J5Q488_9BACE|nr:restriction endonuclease subunit S [Bacteroides xylanisolvens]KAB6335751.1 restriction endonuclease subunit S [Bacteroides xylanisolvens]MCA4528231.1 restriction endonuclease subunit S [Bacteroides ovatus]MCE9417855.1 restriction endonuclease subunit S [Bacteroides xylanisolvens]MCE9454119.1 restriction endonuclease subunit S [Bacteroides xylanisolvens]